MSFIDKIKKLELWNKIKNAGLFKKAKGFVCKSKKHKIISIGLAAIFILIVVSSIINAQNAKIKTVSVSTVNRGELTQSVTITGTIKAGNRHNIMLSPSSKVMKILVKEGQSVAAGDVLAILDDSEYKNQLDKQKINLISATSTLNYISSSGSKSDKAASQAALAQAQATLDSARSSFDDASKKYEQSKVLYSHGYISANELDAAAKAYTNCSSSMASAEAALSSANTAYSNINASLSEKITSQKTQIDLINADIAYLTKKVEDCSLKSNIAGVVTKMPAVEGQYPGTGDEIIVDENSSYLVNLKVSQYDSIKLKEGQKAKIKVKGIDKEYNGTVTKVGSLAEKSVTTTDQDVKVQVEAAITDSDENIKVGYEADADIILDDRQDALQVSFEAVQDEAGTGKKYVFVVGTNGKVEKRYIETGLDTDYYIEVKSGLKEGEKCVSNPDKTLKNGDKVKESGGA
ncbi:MAG: efflux RND transporter periplasmic adaptor subunit [Solirubrobacterales bacterium]